MAIPFYGDKIMGTTNFDDLAVDSLSIGGTSIPNTTVFGIAAGYKLARGTAIATETVAIATGLTTITGYAVSGVGIRLNGLDNLKEQLASGPQCRENIKRLRHNWTMENHIHQVENLYQELLAC